MACGGATSQLQMSHPCGCRGALGGSRPTWGHFGGPLLLGSPVVNPYFHSLSVSVKPFTTFNVQFLKRASHSLPSWGQWGTLRQVWHCITGFCDKNWGALSGMKSVKTCCIWQAGAPVGLWVAGSILAGDCWCAMCRMRS